MPNPAFGVLCPPDSLLMLKKRLRFRYGRGKNIASIIVAFECHSGQRSEFFHLFRTHRRNGRVWSRQSVLLGLDSPDDLIAAMVSRSYRLVDRRIQMRLESGKKGAHYLMPRHGDSP